MAEGLPCLLSKLIPGSCEALEERGESRRCLEGRWPRLCSISPLQAVRIAKEVNGEVAVDLIDKAGASVGGAAAGVGGTGGVQEAAGPGCSKMKPVLK